MKKQLGPWVISAVVALFILLAFNLADAGQVRINGVFFEKIQHSSVKTSSALIATGKGIFHGFILVTDGTNDVTVTAYDGLDATGTKFSPTLTISGSDYQDGWTYSIEPGILFRTGYYIDVSVAGGGTCEFQGFFDQ